jgi:hypothetical protein
MRFLLVSNFSREVVDQLQLETSLEGWRRGKSAITLDWRDCVTRD